MKYYMVELKQWSGEYEAYFIGKITAESLEDATDATHKLAGSWYDDEYEEKDDNAYYFHCGCVAVQVEDIAEVAKEVYDGLPTFISNWDY